MDDTYFLSCYSEEMVQKNNVKREYIQDEGTKLDFTMVTAVDLDLPASPGVNFSDTGSE